MPTDTPTNAAHTPNRLAGSSSPYLLQHAYNPVQWYPWGEEAFELAEKTGKPIFLSVGYATCYWCHVMERESFESEATAAVMNEHFINIKVDREQRPDVDRIYMLAVQLFSQGHGGWPMSVFLTPPKTRSLEDPGLEPFFAGTYFPPPPGAHGRPAFPDLMLSISDAWNNRRGEVLDQAEKVTEHIRLNLGEGDQAVRVDISTVSEAAQALVQIHDTTNGGFGGAPKFPQPVYLDLLLDLQPRINDPAVSSAISNALRLTLDKMALGGMYDQLGGGFHRYAVDATWTVPHFEKMLYDNAQLAIIYAKAAKATGDSMYARVAHETLQYALREMQHDNGGFYSAQDAEVDAREGLNYLWTEQDIDNALNGPTAEQDEAFAKRTFGLDRGTNFRDPHHPSEPPRNVLVLEQRKSEIAKDLKLTDEEFAKQFERVRAQLMQVRNARKQPITDDKIITGWNGLMIDALASCAVLLNNEQYLTQAERAANFTLQNMRVHVPGSPGSGTQNAEELTLARIWRDADTSTEGVQGEAETPAFLEDYAAFIGGLLAIHRAKAVAGNATAEYLNHAITLRDQAQVLFGDEQGRLFDTLEGQQDLIVRTLGSYDGAVPSGASMMLHNDIELHELTRDRKHLDRAFNQLKSLSSEIKQSPVATSNSTRALLRLIVIEPELIDQLPQAEAGSNATPTADTNLEELPVRVMASTDRVQVSRKELATLSLKLEIDAPYHINSFDPGVPGMIPLDVRIEGGTGARLDIVAPAPKTFGGTVLSIGPDGKEHELKMYDKEVVLDLSLARTDEEWTGRPLIVVTYQPCTDSACLEPVTVELDVAIDRGE